MSLSSPSSPSLHTSLPFIFYLLPLLSGSPCHTITLSLPYHSLLGISLLPQFTQPAHFMSLIPFLTVCLQVWGQVSIYSLCFSHHLFPFLLTALSLAPCSLVMAHHNLSFSLFIHPLGSSSSTDFYFNLSFPVLCLPTLLCFLPPTFFPLFLNASLLFHLPNLYFFLTLFILCVLTHNSFTKCVCVCNHVHMHACV